MTEQEAKKRLIEIKKINIKRRLYKYNPERFEYPKETYTYTEVIAINFELIIKPNIQKLFEQDDYLYNQIKNMGPKI